MDFFGIGLTASLVMAAIGVLFHLLARSRGVVGPVNAGFGARLLGALTGPLVAVTLKLPRTLAAIIVDIALLARTGRQSAYRWLMHTLIFAGFMGLLLFHAMDSTITTHFFSGYESTLDPWQWLRNLLGLMALVGLGMAVARRLSVRGLKRLTRLQDWALLALLAAIMISGIGLETAKLLSPAVYDRMVEEYSYAESEEEVEALKAFWTTQGMVFAEPVELTAERLELGAEINADTCAGCHADTASAFVSRPLAMALSPAAGALHALRADLALYYLHVGLCFLGLALLPWGKFLHPLATPANLMARGINRRTEGGELTPAVAEIRRGLGLDACTRCGECSLRCSVRPSFDVLGNADIMPSEKLADLKKHSVTPLTGQALLDFSEGSRICTECHRCTELCSAGIDLQDLWMTSKKTVTGPHQTMRDLGPKRIADIFADCPELPGQRLADQSESFEGCVQCTTCTSVCPVVAVSENPTRDLDLKPQQIMNLLRMGMKDRAIGARMVWSCTTCYKCQEHCPQGVPVADILFELRNVAAARLREVDAVKIVHGEGEETR